MGTHGVQVGSYRMNGVGAADMPRVGMAHT